MKAARAVALAIALGAAVFSAADEKDRAAAVPADGTRRPGVLGQLQFDAMPGIELPLESGTGLFDAGGSLGLRGGLALSSLPWLELGADLGYSFLPLKAGSSLSVASLQACATARWPLDPRLSVYGFAEGGGYWGLVNVKLLGPDGLAYANQQGGGAAARAGLGADWYLSPTVSVGLQLSAHAYLGLGLGMRASAGTTLHLEGRQRRVRLEASPRVELFPSLYKSYAAAPVVVATVRNDERFPIEGVAVSLFVKDLMDAPTTVEFEGRLLPGGEAAIELPAMLSARVLALASESSYPFELGCRYRLNGKARDAAAGIDIPVHGRNAITWDDDGKIASFMDPGSPLVQSFVKPLAVMVREDEPRIVDLDLRMAMGLFEAMGAHGVGYVVDPNTPSFAKSSTDPRIVDFVQYAVQTLAWRGGDCDDLTTLYCSLLEAVGVDCAIITVPGHIFAAFALSVGPKEARKALASTDRLIERGDRVWVPVEVTAVGKPFLQAWAKGANEWSEAAATGTARFREVADCWRAWPSAGSPPDQLKVPDAPLEAARARYRATVGAFVDQELAPREKVLKDRIAQEKDPAKPWEALGVLYGRYGLYDKAEAAFLAAIERRDSLPSLVNLGTIRRLKGDAAGARAMLDRAEALDPRDSGMLLGQALSADLAGARALARAYYGRLAAAAPALAKAYSWLGSGDDAASTRGAGTGAGEESVTWSESE